MQPQSTPSLIAELRPSMRNISIEFIIIERVEKEPTKTKEGNTIAKYRVADRSGSIDLAVWDTQPDALQEGDICRLMKGYTSLYHDFMVIYCTKHSTLERIGEFTMLFKELPNMSAERYTRDPTQTNQFIPENALRSQSVALASATHTATNVRAIHSQRPPQGAHPNHNLHHSHHPHISAHGNPTHHPHPHPYSNPHSNPHPQNQHQHQHHQSHQQHHHQSHQQHQHQHQHHNTHHRSTQPTSAVSSTSSSTPTS